MNRTTFGLCSAAALIIAPSAFAQSCISTLWSEDFEGYVDGENIITGQPCFPICPDGFSWQAWDFVPTVGASVATADFGNPGLSGRIVGDADGSVADDLVHTYRDLALTTGTYLYSTDVFVPNDMTGESYFILLNTYTGEDPGKNWSTQVHLDGDDNNVESDFDAGTVPLQKGVWRELEVIISLDDNLQTIKYDGEVVNAGSKSWTEGVSGGGELTIEAVDLFGNCCPTGATPVYYDNITLCTIPPEGACCFRSDPCVDNILRADCESIQGDAIFQGIGSACGNCAFYGPKGWEIDDLLTNAPPFQWDGDTCNDFPGIPFNPDCDPFPVDCSECDLSDSQDQSWNFTIPWSGTWCFSTCGLADFDTQLFASAVGYCAGDAGFDDDCERLGDNDSELEIALEANDKITILLEGFQVECGIYSLLVGAACEPKDVGPDMELLGPCFDEDTDVENVGCNGDPGLQTFTAIDCGDTFSGTVGNFIAAGAGRRDLDWFSMELTETSTVSMCALGNFPQVVIFLADLDPDPDPCTNAGNILTSDSTDTCVDENKERATAFYSIEVGPGRYSPIISTAFTDPALPVKLGGVPCGSGYEFTITCDGSVPPACAACTIGGDLDGDGCVAFNDINQVLPNWNNTGAPGIPGDANCDGAVNFADINVILGSWGTGPNCP